MKFNKGELILLQKEQGITKRGPLSPFMDFTKYHRLSNSNQFSFISHNNLFLSTLTIEENIVLELSIISPGIDRKKQFYDLLLRPEHTLAKYILSKIKGLELYPHEVTQEVLILAQIVKALLSPTQYIFIDKIEFQIPKDVLKEMIVHLKKYAHAHQKLIIIQGLDLKLWYKISDKIILRTASQTLPYRVIEKINVNKNHSEKASKNSETQENDLIKKRSA